MKFVLAALLILSTTQAFAEACAVAYNEAVGNTDIFSFDDQGKITVHKPELVRINEKKEKTHRIVLKNRGEFNVRYSGGQVISIRIGHNKTKNFNGECQKLQEAMDDNTRTKIDAAIENQKTDSTK